jgi:Zn-dependent metalloprotease
MQSELVDSAFADAYAFFDQGLCYDEAGQTENAKQMYEKGIAIVDEATKVHKSEKSPLYENIVETKKKVEQRLNDIKSGKTSKNEKAVVESLRQEIAHSAADDADLLYWLPEGVQLVVIENGTTAAPTTPSSLIILRLTKEAIEKMPSVENREKPKALIQVGPWAYPLIPGQTTVLKNELGVCVLL